MRSPIFWVLLYASGALAGCGSDDESSATASSGPDGATCLGEFVPSTTCGNVYDDRMLVRIEALEGSPPSQLEAQTVTSCSTSPGGAKATAYSSVVDYPSNCGSGWALAIRVAEGETATTLSPQITVAEAPDPGGIGIQLETELTTCSASAGSYSATGQGSVQLARTVIDKITCSHLQLDDVELSDGVDTFRLTGTIRAKSLPVGAPP